MKIIATLGPASRGPEMIERLYLAGADVFRINMSHSSEDDLKRDVANIRAVEARYGPIAILADLQGPKLRISSFAEGKVNLAAGARFILDANHAPGSAERVGLLHPEIYASAKPGHTLLVDDGKIALKIVEAQSGRLVTEVLVGGPISGRKGVNFPDAVLPLAALTQKDKEDCLAALAAQVDWIALSFVQRPEDVTELRDIVEGRAAVMAKIERRTAIDRMDEILAVSDGIMIARGDLGVELPLEQVPGLQKRLLRAARDHGKPVVVATQMLESMTASPVATRAEVSDVATAVFEGADAIMLSAESATGSYPVEAVATMSKVARQVEDDPSYPDILHFRETRPIGTAADAISAAAASIADALKLKAIICYTATGNTALRVARYRPRQPTLALTPVLGTARKLSLVWGLHCVTTEDPQNVTEMVQGAQNVAEREGYASEGDRVIVSAGVPFGRAGTTNLLRVVKMGENAAR